VWWGVHGGPVGCAVLFDAVSGGGASGSASAAARRS